MGERTEHPHGTFSFVDLSTSDQAGAKQFYGELFGWEYEDVPVGEDGEYAMAALGGKTAAAIGSGGPQQGPPHWNNYVTVDDVDAVAGKVAEAGGTLVMEPFDVFDAGRMCVVQDPTGAFLSLWQAKDSIGAEVVNVPGSLTWNDLNTSDPEAARPFYEQLLGWSFEDMGDGVYWIIKNGDRSNGGMRPFSAEERESQIPSHWLPYFAVDDIEAMLKKSEELGGSPVVGPVEVPNTGRFGVVQDPQGAFYAMVDGDFDD